jgi:hypothetical protein
LIHFYKRLKMAQKKSLVDGISCIAQLGAAMAGEVAGVDLETQNPLTGDHSFEWNQLEEERYRDWIREQIEERPLADFDEFADEESARQRARELTEKNADVEIDWDDEKERELRARYIEMRESGTRVDWDTSGERDAQLQSRMRTQERSKQKVEWDDQDEKACMERYRQKYSK